jgi:peptidoglycan hydrolase-like protein with peptidoglycan-binding domain
MRTIRKNDRGVAVEDVQRRLRVMGYELAVDGDFQQRTVDAVRAFRKLEGLPDGETVDEQTWSALVDASFSLGDRMLYLRMPYFHGADVRSLQKILEVLGFALSDSDGIFGVHTEHALRDFQASVGLVDDGIAGSTTYDAIERLRHAWEGKSPTSAESEQMGYARAAEALEKMEACFYGLDEVGRGVAARVANLARATSDIAHVMSADALEAFPPSTMLMVGITTDEVEGQDGIPMIELSTDYLFARRIRIALSSAKSTPRRVVIEVPVHGNAETGEKIAGERWEQHLAVILLDAFCLAFS